MKIITVLALSVLLAFSTPAPEATPPWASPVFVSAEALQQTAVTIVTDQGSGSGVVLLSASGEVFTWTANHVIDGATTIRIVKQIQSPGRTVGFWSIEADVVGFSKEQDLAVLKPRHSTFFSHGATFAAADYVPKLGDRVFHVGSLRGLIGAESFTDGLISYVGRVLNDGLEYEQISATAVPGSSGGAVFNSESRVIGLVVSGFADTVSFVVPARRMSAWAVAEGHAEWLGK